MAFQRCHATFAGRAVADGRFRLVKDDDDDGGGRLSDRGKMCAED